MLPLSMNLIIIIVTCIISFICFSNQSLLYKLMHNPYRVHHHKEYYRWFTSGFVHADPSHLLFNMLSLYMLGEPTEIYFQNFMPFGAYGQWMYLLMYITAIMASDILTFFNNKNNPHYNSLGASGAVSAVVFSFVLFNPVDAKFYGFIPGYIFAVLYLMISHYFNEKGGGRINHSAHIWGAIYGLAFTIAFNPGIVISCFKQILK